jgi:hypothetical protein
MKIFEIETVLSNYPETTSVKFVVADQDGNLVLECDEITNHREENGEVTVLLSGKKLS